MSDKKEELEKKFEDEDYEEELSFKERFFNPEEKDIDELLFMWRKIKHDPSLEVQNDQTQDFSFDFNRAAFGACAIVANHLFKKIFKVLASSKIYKNKLTKLEDLNLRYLKASVLPIEVDEEDDEYVNYLASLDGPSPFNIEEKRLAAISELLEKDEELSQNDQELFILYAEVVWTMSSL